MRWNDDERLRTVMGLAFATLGPIVVALLLVPIRSDVGNANLALVLVLVVVAAAILGGRRAGAVAAVLATLSFDFFLTKPFLSMEVESSDDVETLLILLGVGLLVGAVASRGRRAEHEREQAADAIGHVHAVADLVARDTPLADVAVAVTRELRALLSLHDCFLAFPPFLYVEDVITLGTPHQGSGWASGCTWAYECVQMENGSSFVNYLGSNAQNPQADGGSDWTLASSYDDGVVSEGSGVGMNANHKQC